MALHSPSLAQTSHGTDVAVVVNSDTPVADLSLSEVRKVMLGERQYWSSKLPVVLLIRAPAARERDVVLRVIDRKSTRLNSSHSQISYAVFCLKKKKKT